MEYRELRIQTEKKDLEMLEAELIGNGFTSMMIDDPDDVRDILEHPDTYRYDYINDSLKEDLMRKPVVTLYFADDEEGLADMKRAEALLDTLAAAEGSDGMGVIYREAAAGDDSEWLYKWQEFFKPTRVGERIVVRPSWEAYDPKPEDLVIEMDPGMAFGSGLHETTSMCIRALEKILADGRGGIKILDVGTGTGILAIAGALLGADEALGIDIDTDAVRVANENIEKNDLADRITAQYGDLTEGVDYKADILVANLMADLVMRLSPAAAGHLERGGWYVTSGILDIKEETVSRAIREAGFAIEEVLHDGEWCAVIARKM
ncbi:MAG: 50S ribosomal protein L11 methyltransferase [Mogibacterium sp.]|nr:50S ribosomal protein L11 methyltransferase [Mogibacterium sp.]